MNIIASISGTLSAAAGTGPSGNSVRVIHDTTPPAPTAVAAVQANDPDASYTDVPFNDNGDAQFLFNKHLSAGSAVGTGTATNSEAYDINIYKDGHHGTDKGVVATIPAGGVDVPFSYELLNDGDFLRFVAA
jgi:hypothetical protein